MEFELLENEKLSDYTTLHIGGEARYLANVTDEGELKAALQFGKANTATPPLILGGGSNVLCSDDGYDGLVIVNQIQGYEVIEESADDVLLQVGAGEVFDDIVARTVKDNYWGLENLSSIPGSVGATPIQNVGAYGVEIESYVENVTAINIASQARKIFTAADCQFNYRDSFFKSVAGRKWCVTEVVYKLSKNPLPVLHYADTQPLNNVDNLSQQQIREHIQTVRSKKFPDWSKVGTAGSFFKNPIVNNAVHADLADKYPDIPSYPVDAGNVKVPLGWILDRVCNLKGYTAGNVKLFENQALVLVAELGATAKEVEQFVDFVSDEVRQKTNIEIEREVLSV